MILLSDLPKHLYLHDIRTPNNCPTRVSATLAITLKRKFMGLSLQLTLDLHEATLLSEMTYGESCYLASALLLEKNTNI